jgi:hypothetical protein
MRALGLTAAVAIPVVASIVALCRRKRRRVWVLVLVAPPRPNAAVAFVMVFV